MWWAAADPSVPASARAFVAYYQRAIRSDTCRDLLRTTKNSNRTCSGMPVFETLWWPSNCALNPSALYKRAGLFHNRSASLFGDSLMYQLGAAVECAAAGTGLRVKMMEFGSSGLLPGRGDHHAIARELRAALENADAAIVNTGAHYNLEPRCSATRLALPNDYPNCDATALARGARADGGGYSPRERELRGLNLRQDLHDDVARFFGLDHNLTKPDGAPRAGAGAGSRVAWRESLPQHYAGGTYSDSLLLHQNALCAPFDVAAVAVANWRNEVTNHPDGISYVRFHFVFRQMPGPAGRGHHKTGPLTASLFFCSCCISSQVTTPLASAAGLRLLPAYAAAVRAADSHPVVPGGKLPCSIGAPLGCDCTHYCLDSAAMAVQVALALEWLASVFSAHPRPAAARGGWPVALPPLL